MILGHEVVDSELKTAYERGVSKAAGQVKKEAELRAV